MYHRDRPSRTRREENSCYSSFGDLLYGLKRFARQLAFTFVCFWHRRYYYIILMRAVMPLLHPFFPVRVWHCAITCVVLCTQECYFLPKSSVVDDVHDVSSREGQ